MSSYLLDCIYDVSHLLEQNFTPVKHYCPLNPKEQNRSDQLDCGQSHVEEILSGLEKLKTFEAQRSVTH